MLEGGLDNLSVRYCTNVVAENVGWRVVLPPGNDRLELCINI